MIGVLLPWLPPCVFLALLAWMWHRSFRDPRWRGASFISRQAAEGEIYNVSDVPALKCGRLVGQRRIRLSFSPRVCADTWRVYEADSMNLLHEGPHPEIVFPADEDGSDFRGREFVIEAGSAGNPGLSQIRRLPQRMVSRSSTLQRLLFPDSGPAMEGGAPRRRAFEMRLCVHHYPKRHYREAGLSWPDFYGIKQCSIPIAFSNAHSAADWAGLGFDDPDCVAARDLMGDQVDLQASSMDRVRQVFLFVMRALKQASGVPSDELLGASPLKTYEMMVDGRGKGFCENKALVYYLFANAAGVPTRLVDASGKAGVLLLTGHYVSESWVEEERAWVYVDPHSARTCSVRDAAGKLMNTLQLKKAVDLHALEGCSAELYEAEAEAIATRHLSDVEASARDYFRGDIVLAFKFGYLRNRFYSKLRTFLWRPTLLYSPLRLPRLYLWKVAALAGLVLSVLLALI